MLLYGVPTQNSTPIPSSARNRNFTRVGARGYISWDASCRNMLDAEVGLCQMNGVIHV